MYTRSFALLSVAAFAAVVAAAPSALEARQPSQCNTGPIQCCQTVGTAADPAIMPLLGDIEVALEDVNAIIGINCSPISIVGLAGGSKCAQQPLCCTDNYQDGAVNIGCTPIDLDL